MPGAYTVTFAQSHSVFSFRFQPVNRVSSAVLSCACGHGPISALAETGSFHIPLFHGKRGDSIGLLEKPHRRRRQQSRESPSMIMTLLWRKTTVRPNRQTGFPPASANCWPGWICCISVITICGTLMSSPRQKNMEIFFNF